MAKSSISIRAMAGYGFHGYHRPPGPRTTGATGLKRLQRRDLAEVLWTSCADVEVMSAAVVFGGVSISLFLLLIR